MNRNSLVRWYHHPKIFPWITQFTLVEWLVMLGTASYILYRVLVYET